MKTKAEVLYAQERNIQNIFEAVMVSFFKKTVPDVNMSDKSMLSIMENAIGTKSFETFKSNYEGKPLGKFLVDVTEQLQDINLFKFEAMEEHIAIAESENPYMMEKKLYDGIDSEFEQIILTDNIKNELADIIENDITTTEENIKKEAELVDDLDNIDPDSEEFDPEKEYNDDEDDELMKDEEDPNAEPKKEGETNEEEEDITEAAWAKVTISEKDIENDNFNDSLEKLIKDKTFVEVELSTKKDIHVKLHNLALEVKSTAKGMVTPDFMKELKGNKADKAAAKYYAWIMTKGCDQSLNNYLGFIVAMMLGLGASIAVISAGYVITGMILSFVLAQVSSSVFVNKSLPRIVVMQTLGASIAVKLQDMKNRASSEEEKSRLETIRNEFMAKAKITEMMCSEYRGMTEQQIKGNLSLITESLNTSFTKVLEEVVTDLAEGAEVSEALTTNTKDIAVMATSMMLVKELYLDK